jgi:predicted TIM-barrel enzyme
MAPPTNRKDILQKLRKSIEDGEIIVGAGAGIGLSAKFIEQGGGDMIIIYNSGRFRMAGRGSLAGLMPYGNANDVMLEMVSGYPMQRLCTVLTMNRQTRSFPSSSIHQYWLEYAQQTHFGIWTDFLSS